MEPSAARDLGLTDDLETTVGWGWLAADGDDVVGDGAQLEVAVRGGGPQDLERLIGGAPVLAHDDAQGLVDDGA
jgi:hypothetical protein